MVCLTLCIFILLVMYLRERTKRNMQGSYILIRIFKLVMDFKEKVSWEPFALVEFLRYEPVTDNSFQSFII